jgi:hypothetical protein
MFSALSVVLHLSCAIREELSAIREVFISSPFDMVATVHMWLLSL